MKQFQFEVKNITSLRNQLEKIKKACETIRERFANETFVNKERITLSLGATPLREGEELLDVCRRVDDALYAAKAAGKNRLVWFD
jgi:GGDEF domain-containing protein